MSAVDVLWVSRHYPDIIARGYADSGMLEALLDRSLWSPPGALELRHHEAYGDDWPDVLGAVVILPARHHASDDDVAWFLERLAALEWSIVMLIGDEEWSFPWRRVTENERRRVWVMQPRPEHEHLSGLLPGGWSPGTRESLARYSELADRRPLDWFFGGQVTHVRRERCVAALRRIPRGRLVETRGYMQGVDREEYRALVASAKVMPCPSGPYTVDTNRPLEAMEAGTVPVADTLTPRGDNFDYWTLVFGETPPFPTLSDWVKLRRHVDHVVDDWPVSSNRVFSWWQRYKRALAHRFEMNLRDVTQRKAETRSENDLITVVVTTSPIDQHPDASIITMTIDSVRAQLPTAEIIIVADGVRPEQEHLRARYDEYKRRLCWLTNFRWSNVVPVLLEDWQHQANATRAALDLVVTPCLLFVEHDTPIEGEIDWAGMCETLIHGDAYMIRLHIYDEIHPEHEHLMLDHETRYVKNVPMRRTVQWWQRPHLANTKFYREQVLALFTSESRTMIEDYMHGVVQSAWIERGDRGWSEWRLWVYCPEGGFKRSLHLDGRAGAEKYAMQFP